MLINQNHKNKRKGLADRIKEQRVINDDEHKQEKDLLKQVNTSNFKIIQSESVNNKKIPYENEQVVERSSGRSTDQEVKRSSDRSTKRSTKRSINREVERSSDRTLSQVIERSSGQEVNRSSEQEIERATDQVPSINSPDFVPEKKPNDLTLEQFQVLHFIYFNRPFKVQSKKGIAIGDLLNPSMTEPNVRNRIKSLVKKGYIDKPRSINDGIKQGSTCTVKLEKCVPLFGASGIDETDQVVEWSSDRKIERVNEQVVERTSEQPQTSYISSSSLSIKKTTTKINNYNMPEFKFWIETGVSEKQIAGWMNDFDLDEFSVLNFLRYAEFDLVENKKIEKVRSVPDWFFGILKETHSYNKPKNFKSYTEKIREKEQMEFEKEKTEYEKLKKIREDRENLKQDMAFEKMLADPEGELYQKCFNNIPDTFKKFYLKKEKRAGKVFYERLRTQFNNLEE